MRPAALAAVAYLAACASSTEASRGFSAGDSASVVALSQEYGRAWLAGDSAAIMELFTDDAVLVPHLGNPHAMGQRAIRDHFWPPDSRLVPVIEFERNSLGVSGINGMAWDRGTYRLAFDFNGDTLGNEGNYLAVARRDERGRWRWVAYTWNHR